MPLSTVNSASSPATAWGRGISIYNAYIQSRNIVSYFLQQGFGLNSGSETWQAERKEGVIVLCVVERCSGRRPGRRARRCCFLAAGGEPLAHFLVSCEQKLVSLLFASIQLFSKPFKQFLKYLIPCVKFLLA